MLLGCWSPKPSNKNKLEKKLETFFAELHLNRMPKILQTYLSDTFAAQLEAKYGPLTGSVLGDIARGALLADIKPVPKPRAAPKEKPTPRPMGRPRVTLEVVESRVLHVLEGNPFSTDQMLRARLRYSNKRVLEAIKSLVEQDKIVQHVHLLNGHVVHYVALTSKEDELGEFINELKPTQ